jgi:hypothetical protein
VLLKKTLANEILARAVPPDGGTAHCQVHVAVGMLQDGVNYENIYSVNARE